MDVKLGQYCTGEFEVMNFFSYNYGSTVKPGLSGWGFHLHFHLIRTAHVKIQTSGCSILLFPGAMASNQA